MLATIVAFWVCLFSDVCHHRLLVRSVRIRWTLGCLTNSLVGFLQSIPFERILRATVVSNWYQVVVIFL